ncbi:hypothetical protein DSECCO2_590450 [anaerobic digester metagenome]
MGPEGRSEPGIFAETVLVPVRLHQTDRHVGSTAVIEEEKRRADDAEGLAAGRQGRLVKFGLVARRDEPVRELNPLDAVVVLLPIEVQLQKKAHLAAHVVRQEKHEQADAGHEADPEKHGPAQLVTEQPHPLAHQPQHHQVQARDHQHHGLEGQPPGKADAHLRPPAQVRKPHHARAQEQGHGAQPGQVHVDGAVQQPLAVIENQGGQDADGPQ